MPLNRLFLTVNVKLLVFFGDKSKNVIPTGAIPMNVQFSMAILKSPVMELKPVINALVRLFAWNVEFLNTIL